MEGADSLNVKSGSLLENSLNLSAILAYDTEVIASCLASPVLISVESAELSESVSGEEHLVLAVVGEHDLGPVYHRSGNESELVAAE